ncbi:hypothetical protein ACGF07_20715 [Kitasatospora sp. NPDC048194]|uniref:hypothetical protein n=1 Tax=Kitasatospora sp. NPDC048194 TaxID=3364045 RepID=UPI0037181E35
MSGITLTLRALHDGERRLERDLLAAAQRHSAEAEVHHVATDLAHWSREHSRRIPTPGPIGRLGEKAAAALGRRPEPGLLLLHDLRELHLGATGNSLYWEMLAQGAQATRDTALLALAAQCHPQTLRQMRWTNTMVKTLAPQLLSSV